MSADLLRRGAAKIREMADATADDGKWYTSKSLDFLAHNLDPQAMFEGGVRATAEHIILWSPDVAGDVADLLDIFADLAEREAYPAEPESPVLRLARRVLGEDE